MNTVDEVKNFPTMIIPNGTEIGVNEHGQLSIRTPGNLVIQNSGVYSIIESANGSVRIDPQVKVEAVSVQAADSCFVAGELTAWRVRASKITLERGARANIILQESDDLELDRNARLVGNFASEKELYLMLGRFSRQLRDLPQNLTRGDREGEQPGSDAGPLPSNTGNNGDSRDDISNEQRQAEGRQQREEVLSLVRVILEREMGRPVTTDAGKKAVERLLELVRTRDMDGLKDNYRYQLSQVEGPSEELEKAGSVLDRLFEKAPIRKP
jgi:hypothetical protein